MISYLQSGKSLKIIPKLTYMRRPGEWMQPMDDRILEILETSGLVLTPSIIAYNLDKSRAAVSRRLSELSHYSLVERVDRGKYKITDKGTSYLSGELDASAMNRDN